MCTRPRLACLALLVALLLPVLTRLGTAQTPTIAEKTRGLTKADGFIPLYWDASSGKLWLELPAALLGRELLYLTGAPTGLGSNDIGLDRGQISRDRIVRFERVGNKVLMVQPNYDFRASDPDPHAQRAVTESFAISTLWGFRVEAESGGNVLVDATDFAIRDVHDAIGTLSRTRQGSYRVDASRSTIYPANTKVFPRNTEIEVSLTLTGDSPGPWVRDVAPTPEALTLRERISLIALPDSGYRPRASIPGRGFSGSPTRITRLPSEANSPAGSSPGTGSRSGIPAPR